MIIRDCMKHKVYSISESATISQAVARLTNRRIGTLPVVNAAGRLVGVLRLNNLLSLVMPDFVNLLDAFDFAHDFGALESRQPAPEVMLQPVTKVMQPAAAVDETCGLLRAFAILNEHQLMDVLVVNSLGQLVGIASRVDIGVALLSGWKLPESRSP
jgi:CBS-domain-containing membrane protein